MWQRIYNFNKKTNQRCHLKQPAPPCPPRQTPPKLVASVTRTNSSSTAYSSKLPSVIATLTAQACSTRRAEQNGTHGRQKKAWARMMPRRATSLRSKRRVFLCEYVLEKWDMVYLLTKSTRGSTSTLHALHQHDIHRVMNHPLSETTFKFHHTFNINSKEYYKLCLFIPFPTPFIIFVASNTAFLLS